MIKQRPSSCQANDKPHQEMILAGFKAKLRPSRNPWRAHDDSYGTSLRRRNARMHPV